MIDNFLKELEEVKDNFDWKIENISGAKCIRGTMKKEVCNGGCCVKEFCPITAVYRIKKGVTEHVTRAHELKIGLTENEMVDVLTSADYRYGQPIRKKLLDILGLKDE